MQLEDGVVVFYTAKAKLAKEQELREALTAGVTGSRYDTGCIIYELHEFKDDQTTFFLYEQWTSQAALDAHLATEPLKKFQAVADQLIEGGFWAGMKQLKKLRPAPAR
jgi:quinol monooxygenase YgiN